MCKGGFEQLASKFTSAGTASGRATRTLVRPGRDAFSPTERKSQVVFIGGPDREARRLRRNRKSNSTIAAAEVEHAACRWQRGQVPEQRQRTGIQALRRKDAFERYQFEPDWPNLEYDFTQSAWVVHGKRSPLLAAATRGRGRDHTRAGNRSIQPV